MRPENMEKKKLFISVALIAVVGFMVYANSLTGSFIWDDKSLVSDNVYIKSPSNIHKIFTENIEAGAGGESCSYRPIQILSYMFDYMFWRLKPTGYHLSSIILHILVALSIYWFINILYDNRQLSFLVSILFVTHPIHTEAVTYISGRADPLALLFMILCFIFYIKHIQRGQIGLYLFSLLSYALALLSRENTIILPALILLYHYNFRIRLKLSRFGPILALSFAYILIRLSILGDLLPHLAQETTFLQRIPGFFAAISDYLRLMFLPLGLHMEYGNKIFNIVHPKVLLGIAITASLLIYCIRKKRGPAFFGISWFFIGLLPSSNLYPINTYMAEHWLYLPSIGFFLIIANGLNRLYTKERLKRVALIGIVVILGSYSFLTIRQNRYWQEPLSFYKRTLKYAPHSARVYNNLGYSYYKVDDFDEALRLCKKSIEIDPTYAKAYYNLGLAYYSLKRYDESEAAYRKALEKDPDYEEVYNNLGIVYSRTGRTEEAIALYNRAMSINSTYPNPYNNLGNTYGIMGRYEEAIGSFKKAIELNPDYGSAHFNLGVTYFHKKEYVLSIEYCDKAIRLGHKVDPGFLKMLEPYRSKNGIRR